MSNFGVDTLIRQHVADKKPVNIGKIVWVEEGPKTGGAPALHFWWIELLPPQETKTGSRQRHYIKSPIVGLVDKALEREAQGEISFVKASMPSEFMLTDDDLQEESSSKGLDRKSRRQLVKWKAKRDAQYALIQPIVETYTVAQLLEEGMADSLLKQRAKELGHPSSTHVELAFRRYLLGGRTQNALLPRWMINGLPGTQKFGKQVTGRPNRAGTQRFLLTPKDSANLQRGWKKYKKPGVSVYDAYLETMREYYPYSTTWIKPTEAKVVLLPPEQRPTQAMFEHHGPKGEPELAAHRINLGERTYRLTHRGLRGSSRAGTIAIGQLGVLDATSEDQQPVSQSSRLLVLPSTWRTMILDNRIGYIFGMHRGFEKGGALAGLLAIEHAAKVKWVWARDELDYELAPDDWEHIIFARTRGDAGDLKNAKGITTMTNAEMSLEFTRSYAADHKLVETGHMIMHRTSDHLVNGTTRGKLLARGEKTSEPSVNMRESWAGKIKAVIQHNNFTPVPELLTMEMRRANVTPTRQKILQWMRNEGYVRSQPYDLELLRAQCLPRMQGTIQKDGIHLWDPRVKDRRYIPGLVYWAEWMEQRGLTARGRESPIPCEININPSFLANAWYSYGSLMPVHLKTEDPELRLTTLADWLYISDQDSLKVFLARGQSDNFAASRVTSARETNKTTLAAKRAEQVAAKSTGNSRPNAQAKRENLEHEQKLLAQQALGLSPPLPKEPSADSTPQAQVSLPPAISPWDDEHVPSSLEEQRMRSLKLRLVA